MAWITAEDVRVFLGPTAPPADDGWLGEVTAAADAFAQRRRAASGYTDDPDLVPSADAKTGTVLYAAALYRERGALEGSASFSEVGTAFYLPTGGLWGQIQRLLGISKPAAA